MTGHNFLDVHLQSLIWSIDWLIDLKGQSNRLDTWTFEHWPHVSCNVAGFAEWWIKRCVDWFGLPHHTTNTHNTYNTQIIIAHDNIDNIFQNLEQRITISTYIHWFHCIYVYIYIYMIMILYIYMYISNHAGFFMHIPHLKTNMAMGNYHFIFLIQNTSHTITYIPQWLTYKGPHGTKHSDVKGGHHGFSWLCVRCWISSISHHARTPGSPDATSTDCTAGKTKNIFAVHWNIECIEGIQNIGNQHNFHETQRSLYIISWVVAKWITASHAIRFHSVILCHTHRSHR